MLPVNRVFDRFRFRRVKKNTQKSVNYFQIPRFLQKEPIVYEHIINDFAVFLVKSVIFLDLLIVIEGL